MRRVERQAQLEEVSASGQGVEVDAERSAVDGVERVDERRVAAPVVERVGPVAAGGHDARDREAAHPLVRIAPVDDRLREQPVPGDVEGPDRVARRVRRRHVLDEVDRRSIRRKGVEAEGAGERDRALHAQAHGVDQRQAHASLRGAGRIDQDERAPVGGEAAARAVIRDGGHDVLAADDVPALDGSARAADPLDDRPPRAGGHSHVAIRAARRRDAFTAAEAALRSAVGGGGRGDCERGEHRAEEDLP